MPARRASQVERLLDQIDLSTADGAYDRDPIYNAVLRNSAEARIVIPPRSLWGDGATVGERAVDVHIGRLRKGISIGKAGSSAQCGGYSLGDF